MLENRLGYYKRPVTCPSPSNSSGGPPASTTSPLHEGRLHGLDLLRGIAMVLGVVLHTAVPYTRFDIPWVYRVPTPNSVYDLGLVAIHSFRMPLFFLLAGFFGHLQQQRLGASPFLRQRLLRIGVPFAVGMVTLMPWMVFMVLQDTTDLNAFRKAHGTPIPVGATVSPPLHLLPTFHLWFLEVLLICYGLFWSLTLLTRGRMLCSERVDRIVAWGLRSVWPVALLAGPCLVWFEGSRPGDGVSFLQYATLTPGVRILGFSLSFFAMGAWLHRNATARRELGERWRPMMMAGVVSLVVLLGIRWQLLRQDLHLTRFQEGLGLLAEGCTAWFLSLGLFALGLQALDRPPRWTRYFADASYWLYLIHLPLVFWIQLRIRDWPIPIVAKFFLCLCGVTALGLQSYHLLVRDTWVGWLLNGRRASQTPRS